MSMLKRNDGYALSYVLVILLVLSVIAISTLSAPLHNLQTQQTSIARMQDKYVAQGMVEKVIAQMQTAKSETELKALTTDDNTLACQCEGFKNAIEGKLTATVTAKQNKTTITATVLLSPITVDIGEGESQETKTTGYSVTYYSYNVEVQHDAKAQ